MFGATEEFEVDEVVDVVEVETEVDDVMGVVVEVVLVGELVEVLVRANTPAPTIIIMTTIATITIVLETPLRIFCIKTPLTISWILMDF